MSAGMKSSYGGNFIRTKTMKENTTFWKKSSKDTHHSTQKTIPTVGCDTSSYTFQLVRRGYLVSRLNMREVRHKTGLC